MLVALRGWSLRRTNNVLSIIVVGMSVYIGVLPLLPKVTYKVDEVLHIQPALVKANLPVTTAQDDPVSHTEEIPKDNTLVIPSINFAKVIYDGNSVDTLKKGLWRRPNTSTPGKGSNTVLAGHRYGYNGDGVFYHLDRVEIGDAIYMYWQGKKIKYSVESITVVSPDKISVEAPTQDPVLTLYTCTPLWSFTERLVIIAKEVS